MGAAAAVGCIPATKRTSPSQLRFHECVLNSSSDSSSDSSAMVTAESGVFCSTGLFGVFVDRFCFTGRIFVFDACWSAATALPLDFPLDFSAVLDAVRFLAAGAAVVFRAGLVFAALGGDVPLAFFNLAAAALFSLFRSAAAFFEKPDSFCAKNSCSSQYFFRLAAASSSSKLGVNGDVVPIAGGLAVGCVEFVAELLKLNVQPCKTLALPLFHELLFPD